MSVVSNMISVQDIDLLGKNLLSNEKLDELLHTTKTLKQIYVLLCIKENRIGACDSIDLDIEFIYSNLLDDLSNTELVCDIISKYLVVCKDSPREITQIQRYIHSVIKSANDEQCLSLLRLLYEVLVFKGANNIIDEWITEDILYVWNHTGLLPKKYLNSQLIPVYVKKLDADCLTQFLNTLFETCKLKVNLDIICNISNIISADILSNFIKPNIETFIKCLNSDKQSIQKQSIYLLRKCLHINQTIMLNEAKVDLEAWETYFTLLEVSREKQLHLILPSLKHTKVIIENFDFNWQWPLLKMLLNHSQTTVVLKTANAIIESSIITSLECTQLSQLFNLLLISINKTECSDHTDHVFKQLSGVVNKDNIILIFLNSLKDVPWNPTIFWYLTKNIFSNNFPINVSQFVLIMGILKKLPHRYIREGCMSLFLKFSFQSFNLKIENFNEFLIVSKILCKIVKLNDVIQGHMHHFMNQIQQYLLDPSEELLEVQLFLLKVSDLSNSVTLNKNIKKLKPMLQMQMVITSTETFNSIYAMMVNDNYFHENDFSKADKKSYLLFEFYRKHQQFKNALTPVEKEIFIDFCFTQNDSLVDFWLPKFLTGSRNGNLCRCLGFVYYYCNALTSSEMTTSLRDFFILVEYLFENLTPKDNVTREIFINLERIIEACDEEYTLKFINLCYQQLQDINHVNILLCMKHYMAVLLKLSQNFDFAIEIIASLLNDDKYSDLASESFTYCTGVILSENEGFNWLPCIPLIIQALLTNVLIQKEHRIEYNVCQDIKKKTGVIDGLQFQRTNSRDEVIDLISKVSMKSSKLADEFAVQLMVAYKKHFNKRYFPDSQIHIHKLRIMESLLCLTPYLGTQKANIINLIVDSFTTEINQPCVRQLMQGILIFLAKDQEQHILSVIKSKIDCTVKNQPSSIVAFIPVILQITLGLDTYFWHLTIEILLPYCMGAHFKLRVYSQMALKVLLDNLAFDEKYNFLRNSIENVIAASGQPFFDTLKSDLHLFNVFGSKKWLDYKHIFIKCNNNVSMELEKPQPDLMETSNNIQRKISPWRDEITEENDSKSNFIFIASLLDKSTNLGGLSRTCEVFGVKTMAVDNGRVVNDKEFQSLSMTSEKWVKIVEVKISDLVHYIRNLKNKGYCVVGAEQTAESVMLDKYEFAEKTALLLGNEKYGIPANLIPLLDVCVEIPQFGLVRSLNVHVAGATFLWEYTKQHKT